MTTRIYIRARDPSNGARVVQDLLGLGLSPQRLQVIGKRLPADLPVKATRWQTRERALLPVALIGAVALPAIVALILAGISAGAALLLALLGAAVAGGWQWYRIDRTRAPLAAQQQSLSRGDLMIVADVEQSALGQVESRLAEQHPEVLLLGPDPAGSPPFP
jgi:hypothetical protein